VPQLPQQEPRSQQELRSRRGLRLLPLPQAQRHHRLPTACWQGPAGLVKQTIYAFFFSSQKIEGFNSYLQRWLLILNTCWDNHLLSRIVFLIFYKYLSAKKQATK
jgi:hypothetical protein